MKIKKKLLQLNPPTKTSEEDLQKFLNDANNPEKSGSSFVNNKSTDFPWEDEHVREDLKKTFNLRLSEKDFVKLEYLARLKKDSMHKVCTDILIPQINKMLNL